MEHDLPRRQAIPSAYAGALGRSRSHVDCLPPLLVVSLHPVRHMNREEERRGGIWIWIFAEANGHHRPATATTQIQKSPLLPSSLFKFRLSSRPEFQGGPADRAGRR